MPQRSFAAWICLLLMVLISSAQLPQVAGQQPAPPSSPSVPATHPDDQFWDDQFVTPGTGDQERNQYVEALALAPNGDLYAGGFFIREQLTLGLARWNGRAWLPVGNFVGAVHALAFNGNDLYVGGKFDPFNSGVATNNITRWDGTSWSALGSGVSQAGGYGVIYDIVVSNGVIYAAGFFDLARGVAASNIARWDGTSWSALGSGINDIIYDLAVSDGILYAGGSFTSAGGVAANNIARWDGTGWSALGSGTNGAVQSILQAGATIYAGGAFSLAGGGPARNMARWDGSSWSALGAGPPHRVRDLMLRGGLIYAGTQVEPVGASPSLYTWNGATWTAFPSTFEYQEAIGGVYALAQNAGTFYVGGAFEQINLQVLNNVARWSGTEWLNLGKAPGLKPAAPLIARLGLSIYYYAIFDGYDQFLSWDGVRWRQHSSMTTTGEAFQPEELTSSGTQLYGLDPSGGRVTLARWNGTRWEVIGTCAWRSSSTAAGNNFYVANPGDVNGMTTRLARWDGTAWTSMVNDTGSDVYIHRARAAGSDLYISGQFSAINGVAATNIARWNGTAWSALGNPGSGGVAQIAVDGSRIYIANFERIAMWNGAQWIVIGTGPFSDYINMAVMDGQLYIAGRLSSISGVAVSGIARWDGSAWSALGSGLSTYENGVPEADHLVVDGHNLYVAGPFTGAGGHESIGFARWNMSPAIKTYIPFAVR